MSNQNESLNVSAKSVEEAIEQGLAQLGLTRDQVEIEVISEAKRSLFGFKSENASVRLTPKLESLEEPSEVADVGQKAVPEPAGDSAAYIDQAPAGDTPEQSDAAEIETDDQEAAEAEYGIDPIVADLGVEYLSGLLERMSIKAQVTRRVGTDLVEPGEQPPLVLDITGNDLGILIGRRNETLQALQYMVRLMVSKTTDSWQRIVVDVESYRSRRRRSLHQMAIKMAERAAANGERVVLESMSAYDRRLIHIALRDHPSVVTKSIGHDRNRKVTIIPK